MFIWTHLHHAQSVHISLGFRFFLDNHVLMNKQHRPCLYKPTYTWYDWCSISYNSIEPEINLNWWRSWEMHLIYIYNFILMKLWSCKITTYLLFVDLHQFVAYDQYRAVWFFLLLLYLHLSISIPYLSFSSLLHFISFFFTWRPTFPPLPFFLFPLLSLSLRLQLVWHYAGPISSV